MLLLQQLLFGGSLCVRGRSKRSVTTLLAPGMLLLRQLLFGGSLCAKYAG